MKKKFEEIWKSIRRWWWYNGETVGFISIFIGAIGCIIGIICAFDYYKDSKYDYEVRIGGSIIWVNEEDVKIENNTLIIERDNEKRIYRNFTIIDNRRSK